MDVSTTVRPSANYQASSAINYSVSSTAGSPTDISGATVTITTTGRPVMVVLTPAGSAVQTGVIITNTSGTARGWIYLYRGGSETNRFLVQGLTGGTVSKHGHPGSMVFMDFQAAGTYTYKLGAYMQDGTLFEIADMKLVAYEL